MNWSKDQLEQYNEDGYLVVKNLLSSSELNSLKSDLPILSKVIVSEDHGTGVIYTGE